MRWQCGTRRRADRARVEIILKKRGEILWSKRGGWGEMWTWSSKWRWHVCDWTHWHEIVGTSLFKKEQQQQKEEEEEVVEEEMMVVVERVKTAECSRVDGKEIVSRSGERLFYNATVEFSGLRLRRTRVSRWPTNLATTHAPGWNWMQVAWCNSIHGWWRWLR